MPHGPGASATDLEGQDAVGVEQRGGGLVRRPGRGARHLWGGARQVATLDGRMEEIKKKYIILVVVWGKNSDYNFNGNENNKNKKRDKAQEIQPL